MLKKLKPKTISQIVNLLHKEYGSPRLGNKNNPVDELVYIILSTKTSDKVYQRTYEKIRDKYLSWEKLLKADIDEIAKVIEFGGLGKQKAKLIKNSLTRIKERFGKVNLDFLRKKRNLKEIEELLLSLPGVGIKTTKCIMLYSLNKKVLPVDTHTHRLTYRLGWIKRREMRNEKGKLHELLEMIVPKSLRYKLHVNAVAHGRKICLPRKPRCERCPLTRHCEYYREGSSFT